MICFPVSKGTSDWNGTRISGWNGAEWAEMAKVSQQLGSQLRSSTTQQQSAEQAVRDASSQYQVALAGAQGSDAKIAHMQEYVTHLELQYHICG